MSSDFEDKITSYNAEIDLLKDQGISYPVDGRLTYDDETYKFPLTREQDNLTIIEQCHSMLRSMTYTHDRSSFHDAIDIENEWTPLHKNDNSSLSRKELVYKMLMATNRDNAIELLVDERFTSRDSTFCPTASINTEQKKKAVFDVTYLNQMYPASEHGIQQNENQVNIHGFYSKTMGNVKTSCPCGDAVHFQGADLCCMHMSALSILEGMNLEVTAKEHEICYDIQFSFQVRQTLETSQGYLCQNHALSDLHGILPVESKEYFSASDSTSYTIDALGLLLHPVSGVSLANFQTANTSMQESILESNRVVYLENEKARVSNDLCGSPEDTVVAESAFPVISTVAESPVTAACVRFGLEAKWLEMLHDIQESSGLSALEIDEKFTPVILEAVENKNLWERRCHARLKKLQSCHEMSAFSKKMQPDKPAEKFICEFSTYVNDPEIFMTSSKPCLVGKEVNGVVNFYDPYLCNFENKKIIQSFELRDDCMIFNPLRFLATSDSDRVDGVPLLSYASMNDIFSDEAKRKQHAILGLQPGQDFMFPTNTPSSVEFPSVSYWPQDWQAPFGELITDDWMYSSGYSNYMAAVTDGEGKAVDHIAIMPTMLRPDKISQTQSGSSGFCREHSFGMEVFHANTLRICSEEVVSSESCNSIRDSESNSGDIVNSCSKTAAVSMGGGHAHTVGYLYPILQPFVQHIKSENKYKFIADRFEAPAEPGKLDVKLKNIIRYYEDIGEELQIYPYVGDGDIADEVRNNCKMSFETSNGMPHQCYTNSDCTGKTEVCDVTGQCKKVLFKFDNNHRADIEVGMTCKGCKWKQDEKKNRGASPWKRVSGVLETHGLCSHSNAVTYERMMMVLENYILTKSGCNKSFVDEDDIEQGKYVTCSKRGTKWEYINHMPETMAKREFIENSLEKKSIRSKKIISEYSFDTTEKVPDDIVDMQQFMTEYDFMTLQPHLCDLEFMQNPGWCNLKYADAPEAKEYASWMRMSESVDDYTILQRNMARSTLVENGFLSKRAGDKLRFMGLRIGDMKYLKDEQTQPVILKCRELGICDLEIFTFGGIRLPRLLQSFTPARVRFADSSEACGVGGNIDDTDPSMCILDRDIAFIPYLLEENIQSECRKVFLSHNTDFMSVSREQSETKIKYRSQDRVGVRDFINGIFDLVGSFSDDFKKQTKHVQHLRFIKCSEEIATELKSNTLTDLQPWSASAIPGVSFPEVVTEWISKETNGISQKRRGIYFLYDYSSMEVPLIWWLKYSLSQYFFDQRAIIKQPATQASGAAVVINKGLLSAWDWDRYGFNSYIDVPAWSLRFGSGDFRKTFFASKRKITRGELWATINSAITLPNSVEFSEQFFNMISKYILIKTQGSTAEIHIGVGKPPMVQMAKTAHTAYIDTDKARGDFLKTFHKKNNDFSNIIKQITDSPQSKTIREYIDTLNAGSKSTYIDQFQKGGLVESGDEYVQISGAHTWTFVRKMAVEDGTQLSNKYGKQFPCDGVSDEFSNFELKPGRQYTVTLCSASQSIASTNFFYDEIYFYNLGQHNYYFQLLPPDFRAPFEVAPLASTPTTDFIDKEKLISHFIAEAIAKQTYFDPFSEPSESFDLEDFDAWDNLNSDSSKPTKIPVFTMKIPTTIDDSNNLKLLEDLLVKLDKEERCSTLDAELNTKKFTQKPGSSLAATSRCIFNPLNFDARSQESKEYTTPSSTEPKIKITSSDGTVWEWNMCKKSQTKNNGYSTPNSKVKDGESCTFLDANEAHYDTEQLLSGPCSEPGPACDFKPGSDSNIEWDSSILPQDAGTCNADFSMYNRNHGGISSADTKLYESSSGEYVHAGVHYQLKHTSLKRNRKALHHRVDTDCFKNSGSASTRFQNIFEYDGQPTKPPNWHPNDARYDVLRRNAIGQVNYRAIEQSVNAGIQMPGDEYWLPELKYPLPGLNLFGGVEISKVTGNSPEFKKKAEKLYKRNLPVDSTEQSVHHTEDQANANKKIGAKSKIKQIEVLSPGLTVTAYKMNDDFADIGAFSHIAFNDRFLFKKKHRLKGRSFKEQFMFGHFFMEDHQQHGRFTHVVPVPSKSFCPDTETDPGHGEYPYLHHFKRVYVSKNKNIRRRFEKKWFRWNWNLGIDEKLEYKNCKTVQKTVPDPAEEGKTITTESEQCFKFSDDRYAYGTEGIGKSFDDGGFDCYKGTGSGDDGWKKSAKYCNENAFASYETDAFKASTGDDPYENGGCCRIIDGENYKDSDNNKDWERDKKFSSCNGDVGGRRFHKCVPKTTTEFYSMIKKIEAASSEWKAKDPATDSFHQDFSDIDVCNIPYGSSSTKSQKWTVRDLAMCYEHDVNEYEKNRNVQSFYAWASTTVCDMVMNFVDGTVSKEWMDRLRKQALASSSAPNTKVKDKIFLTEILVGSAEGVSPFQHDGELGIEKLKYAESYPFLHACTPHFSQTCKTDTECRQLVQASWKKKSKRWNGDFESFYTHFLSKCNDCPGERCDLRECMQTDSGIQPFFGSDSCLLEKYQETYKKGELSDYAMRVGSEYLSESQVWTDKQDGPYWYTMWHESPSTYPWGPRLSDVEHKSFSDYNMSPKFWKELVSYRNFLQSSTVCDCHGIPNVESLWDPHKFYEPKIDYNSHALQKGVDFEDQALSTSYKKTDKDGEWKAKMNNAKTNCYSYCNHVIMKKQNMGNFAQIQSAIMNQNLFGNDDNLYTKEQPVPFSLSPCIHGESAGTSTDEFENMMTKINLRAASCRKERLSSEFSSLGHSCDVVTRNMKTRWNNFYEAGDACRYYYKSQGLSEFCHYIAKTEHQSDGSISDQDKVRNIVVDGGLYNDLKKPQGLNAEPESQAFIFSKYCKNYEDGYYQIVAGGPNQISGGREYAKKETFQNHYKDDMWPPRVAKECREAMEAHTSTDPDYYLYKNFLSAIIPHTQDSVCYNGGDRTRHITKPTQWSEWDGNPYQDYLVPCVGDDGIQQPGCKHILQKIEVTSTESCPVDSKTVCHNGGIYSFKVELDLDNECVDEGNREFNMYLEHTAQKCWHGSKDASVTRKSMLYDSYHRDSGTGIAKCQACKDYDNTHYHLENKGCIGAGVWNKETNTMMKNDGKSGEDIIKIKSDLKQIQGQFTEILNKKADFEKKMQNLLSTTKFDIDGSSKAIPALNVEVTTPLSDPTNFYITAYLNMKDTSMFTFSSELESSADYWNADTLTPNTQKCDMDVSTNDKNPSCGFKHLNPYMASKNSRQVYDSYSSGCAQKEDTIATNLEASKCKEPILSGALSDIKKVVGKVYENKFGLKLPIVREKESTSFVVDDNMAEFSWYEGLIPFFAELQRSKENEDDSFLDFLLDKDRCKEQFREMGVSDSPCYKDTDDKVHVPVPWLAGEYGFPVAGVQQYTIQPASGQDNCLSVDSETGVLTCLREFTRNIHNLNKHMVGADLCKVFTTENNYFHRMCYASFCTDKSHSGSNDFDIFGVEQLNDIHKNRTICNFSTAVNDYIVKEFPEKSDMRYLRSLVDSYKYYQVFPEVKLCDAQFTPLKELTEEGKSCRHTQAPLGYTPEMMRAFIHNNVAPSLGQANIFDTDKVEKQVLSVADLHEQTAINTIWNSGSNAIEVFRENNLTIGRDSKLYPMLALDPDELGPFSIDLVLDVNSQLLHVDGVRLLPNSSESNYSKEWIGNLIQNVAVDSALLQSSAVYSNPEARSGRESWICPVIKQTLLSGARSFYHDHQDIRLLTPDPNKMRKKYKRMNGLHPFVSSRWIEPSKEIKEYKKIGYLNIFRNHMSATEKEKLISLSDEIDIQIKKKGRCVNFQIISTDTGVKTLDWPKMTTSLRSGEVLQGQVDQVDMFHVMSEYDTKRYVVQIRDVERIERQTEPVRRMFMKHQPSNRRMQNVTRSTLDPGGECHKAPLTLIDNNTLHEMLSYDHCHMSFEDEFVRHRHYMCKNATSVKTFNLSTTAAVQYKDNELRDMHSRYGKSANNSIPVFAYTGGAERVQLERHELSISTRRRISPIWRRVMELQRANISGDLLYFSSFWKDSNPFTKSVLTTSDPRAAFSAPWVFQCIDGTVLGSVEYDDWVSDSSREASFTDIIENLQCSGPQETTVNICDIDALKGICRKHDEYQQAIQTANARHEARLVDFENVYVPSSFYLQDGKYAWNIVAETYSSLGLLQDEKMKDTCPGIVDSVVGGTKKDRHSNVQAKFFDIQTLCPSNMVLGYSEKIDNIRSYLVDVIKLVVLLSDIASNFVLAFSSLIVGQIQEFEYFMTNVGIILVDLLERIAELTMESLKIFFRQLEQVPSLKAIITIVKIICEWIKSIMVSIISHIETAFRKINTFGWANGVISELQSYIADIKKWNCGDLVGGLCGFQGTGKRCIKNVYTGSFASSCTHRPAVPDQLGGFYGSSQYGNPFQRFDGMCTPSSKCRDDVVSYGALGEVTFKKIIHCADCPTIAGQALSAPRYGCGADRKCECGVAYIPPSTCITNSDCTTSRQCYQMRNMQRTETLQCEMNSDVSRPLCMYESVQDAHGFCSQALDYKNEVQKCLDLSTNSLCLASLDTTSRELHKYAYDNLYGLRCSDVSTAISSSATCAEVKYPGSLQLDPNIQIYTPHQLRRRLLSDDSGNTETRDSIADFSHDVFGRMSLAPDKFAHTFCYSALKQTEAVGKEVCTNLLLLANATLQNTSLSDVDILDPSTFYRHVPAMMASDTIRNNLMNGLSSAVDRWYGQENAMETLLHGLASHLQMQPPKAPLSPLQVVSDVLENSRHSGVSLRRLLSVDDMSTNRSASRTQLLQLHTPEISIHMARVFAGSPPHRRLLEVEESSDLKTELNTLNQYSESLANRPTAAPASAPPTCVRLNEAQNGNVQDSLRLIITGNIQKAVRRYGWKERDVCSESDQSWDDYMQSLQCPIISNPISEVINNTITLVQYYNMLSASDCLTQPNVSCLTRPVKYQRSTPFEIFPSIPPEKSQRLLQSNVTNDELVTNEVVNFVKSLFNFFSDSFRDISQVTYFWGFFSLEASYKDEVYIRQKTNNELTLGLLLRDFLTCDLDETLTCDNTRSPLISTFFAMFILLLIFTTLIPLPSVIVFYVWTIGLTYGVLFLAYNFSFLCFPRVPICLGEGLYNATNVIFPDRMQVPESLKNPTANTRGTCKDIAIDSTINVITAFETVFREDTAKWSLAVVDRCIDWFNFEVCRVARVDLFRIKNFFDSDENRVHDTIYYCIAINFFRIPTFLVALLFLVPALVFVIQFIVTVLVNLLLLSASTSRQNAQILSSTEEDED